MQRIIKRYPNRKLYDTELSRYVVLSELVATINSGIEVQVLDHKSKEDVTRKTLVSALYEKELTTPKFSLEQIKTLLK